MDQRHLLLVTDPGELAHVEEHGEGILRPRGEGNPDAALGLELAHETAALGRHQGPGARMDEALGDIHRGALRPAGLELGNDLQDGSACQGMNVGRRETCSSAGSR